MHNTFIYIFQVTKELAHISKVSSSYPGIYSHPKTDTGAFVKKLKTDNLSCPGIGPGCIKDGDKRNQLQQWRSTETKRIFYKEFC